MINLWGLSNISKISNNRSLNNENSSFLVDSWNINYPVLNRYIHDNKLTKKYFNLFYCHRQFKVISRFNYVSKFWFYYFLHFLSKIFYFLNKYIPVNLKKYLKSKLKNA